MKCSIVRAYDPVYIVLDDESSYFDVEIPDDLVSRNKQAEEAYAKTQTELEPYYKMAK